MVEELLAQLIEEVSVLTADRRRKKPIEIPRPYHAKDKATRSADGSVHARGHRQMLAVAAARVRPAGAVSNG